MREVDLPAGIAGRLYLDSMPGRWRPIEEFVREAAARKIDCVVCLTPADEILRKSPAYAELLAGETRWQRLDFPIEDFRAPEQQALQAHARQIAEQLRAGRNVLIHCGAGIGRTGTVATAVLTCLGLDHDAALQTVEAVGSGPENKDQERALEAFARKSCAQ